MSLLLWGRFLFLLALISLVVCYMWAESRQSRSSRLQPRQQDRS